MTKFCKKQYNKQYKAENKEKIKESNKQYYAKNKEKINKRKVKYNNYKYKTDPKFKLIRNIRTRIYKSLARQKTEKFQKSINYLGCNLNELQQHLEMQFKPGMSWDNKDLWHIDHIIPLSHFDFTNQDDIYWAFHYTNLQPLWAEENLSKGNRYVG